MYGIKVLAISAFFATVACGGGGGGGLGFASSGNFPQPEDFFDAMNRFDSLVGTDGYTNPANFPGFATYRGVVALQRSGGQYYGELEMTASFDDGDFSGTLDNFNEFDFSTQNTTAVDVDGSFSMSGNLTGNNGGISNALNGTATGTLDDLPDTLDVTGQFAGDEAEGVRLLLVGGVFQGAADGLSDD